MCYQFKLSGQGAKRKIAEQIIIYLEIIIAATINRYTHDSI
jgi:hypothetical protein